MIPGISSFTYGWSVGVPGKIPPVPLEEMALVKIAVENGITRLQIGDNLPLHTFPEIRLSALRSAISENGIRLELGARNLTASHLRRYIDLAVFFHSPLIRFVIDDAGYSPSVADIAAILKEAIPELKKHDITLGIENHDRLRASEFAQLIETVADSRIGICLDCINSMGAGEGLEEVSRILAPLTVNLHLKDFIVQRLPHKMGFTVTGAPLGKGMTRVHELLDKVAGHGRCQSVIFEQWVPPEDSLEQTIRKEGQWAREGIEFMKNLPQFKANKPTN